LVKSYGSLRAVDGVSFTVAKGELYGLLGPNGAGKTTIMSMLSGLLAPDEGRVLFDGVDLAGEPLKVKAQLGVVPQEPALYENLSARENLAFWGGLYGLSGAPLKKAVELNLSELQLLTGAPLQAGEKLRDKIEDQLAKLQQMPGLVRSFFRHPSVAYIADC
jgi:ABC-2 type transport system ATP-binding protein